MSLSAALCHVTVHLLEEFVCFFIYFHQVAAYNKTLLLMQLRRLLPFIVAKGALLVHVRHVIHQDTKGLS